MTRLPKLGMSVAVVFICALSSQADAVKGLGGVGVGTQQGGQGSFTLEVRDDAGAISDQSDHAFLTVSGVKRIRATYRAGKGSAAGGLATTTGIAPTGVTCCTAVDVVIDTNFIENICTSTSCVPVSIQGFVD